MCVCVCVRACVCVCVSGHMCTLCVRATDVFAPVCVCMCVSGDTEMMTQCNTYYSAFGDKHAPLLDVCGVGSTSYEGTSKRVCGDNLSVARNRIPTPVTCSSKPAMRLNCT